MKTTWRVLDIEGNDTGLMFDLYVTGPGDLYFTLYNYQMIQPTSLKIEIIVPEDKLKFKEWISYNKHVCTIVDNNIIYDNPAVGPNSSPRIQADYEWQTSQETATIMVKINGSCGIMRINTSYKIHR